MEHIDFLNFLAAYSVALLSVPTHQHNGGTHYVKYKDAVEVAQEVYRAFHPKES